MSDIVEEIKKYANKEGYLELKEKSDFFLPPIFDIYQKYLDFDISDGDIDFLIEQSKKVSRDGNNDELYSDKIIKVCNNDRQKIFIELLFELIAYIDYNAANKTKYNQGETLIGRTGLMQTQWVGQFLQYKKDEKSVTAPNFLHCIEYIKNPVKRYPILSDERYKQIEKAFPKLLDTDWNLCKCEKNNTKLIASILHLEQDIRKQWDIPYINFMKKLHTIDAAGLVMFENSNEKTSFSENDLKNAEITKEILSIKEQKNFQFPSTISNHIDKKKEDSWIKINNGKYSLTQKGKEYFSNKYIEYLNMKNEWQGQEGDIEEVELEGQNMEQPLNQILYGPPGTGKTYNTVIKAMEIIKPDLIKWKNVNDHSKGVDNYKTLKEEFDKLLDSQIEFVTFHQSYSYEEFVEGIRPNVPDGDFWGDEADNVKYIGRDGIFKRICRKAENSNITEDNDFGLNSKPTIWKVSLKSSGENDVRKDCMENNHIRVGFDEYGETVSEETDFYAKGKNVLNAFINKMKIGDVVLSCYSADTIDAIGVITGDYRWCDEYENHKRVRDVNWIKKWDGTEKYNIRGINENKSFSDPTVHEAFRISLNDVIDVINNNMGTDVKYQESKDNYVLVIDEINRGNISKIFGELITLIEEDKRKNVTGEEKEYNTLEVTLPYSGNPFSVPNNLYIIGTMNTSDRSIASVDIALRRRFKFVEMMPKASVFENNDFDKSAGFSLTDIFKKMNERICALLDRDHQIGHSYFIGVKTVSQLKQVWFDSVMPLLNEYFYGDWEKLQAILGKADEDEKGCSFIQAFKTDKLFADGTDSDICEDEYYDFRQASAYDDNNFKEAMVHAFGDKIKQKNDSTD